MRSLVTEEDLRKEDFGRRCRQALKIMDVPAYIIKEFDHFPWPMLFQFAHLCVNAEWAWRDAYNWCFKNKDAIITHGATLEQDGTTPTKAD